MVTAAVCTLAGADEPCGCPDARTTVTELLRAFADNVGRNDGISIVASLYLQRHEHPEMLESFRETRHPPLPAAHGGGRSRLARDEGRRAPRHRSRGGRRDAHRLLSLPHVRGRADPGRLARPGGGRRRGGGWNRCRPPDGRGDAERDLPAGGRQALRRPHRGRRPRPGGARGRVLRSARAKRRRQVDHDAVAHRPGAGRRGRDPCAGPRAPGRVEAGEDRDGGRRRSSTTSTSS